MCGVADDVTGPLGDPVDRGVDIGTADRYGVRARLTFPIVARVTQGRDQHGGQARSNARSANGVTDSGSTRA